MSTKNGIKLGDVRICSSSALSFHFWFLSPGSIPLMLRRRNEGGVIVHTLVWVRLGMLLEVACTWEFVDLSVSGEGRQTLGAC